jgi:tRNA 5-methylaminomethyl-2-thiouridine biosynthesis bifunctional protein
LIYDFIVVGGGVAGASISYFLEKGGFSVLLFEKEKLGAGGSGTAGAFLNPKVGKKGPLNDLVNSAMNFSIELYKKEFQNDFYPTPLLHYGENDEVTKIENAGIIDPVPVLKKLTERVDIEFREVKEPIFDGEYWSVDEFKGNNLFLTTGAYPNFLKEQSIHIRPVWGQRIDVKIDKILDESRHREVSISRTVKGSVRIGATHHRDVFSRDISEEDSQKILEKASFLSEIEGAEVIKAYGGVRSASIDYFPLIGRVPNTEESLKNYPTVKRGAKVKPTDLSYFPNLFMFSGLGGYGYSLSPYLANSFVKSYKKGEFGDKQVEPYRFLWRQVKRGTIF